MKVKEVAAKGVAWFKGLTPKKQVIVGVVGAALVVGPFVGGGETTPAPEPEQTITTIEEAEAQVAEQTPEHDAESDAELEAIESELAEQDKQAAEWWAEQDKQAAERKAAEEAAEQAVRDSVTEPLNHEITDAMLAHQSEVWRSGNAVAVQDPESGRWVIAMYAWVDDVQTEIVMVRESLEVGPSRQWALDDNAHEALPRVPWAASDTTTDVFDLVDSDAYDVALEELRDGIG